LNFAETAFLAPGPSARAEAAVKKASENELFLLDSAEAKGVGPISRKQPLEQVPP
jgi:hypothetical protein